MNLNFIPRSVDYINSKVYLAVPFSPSMAYLSYSLSPDNFTTEVLASALTLTLSFKYQEHRLNVRDKKKVELLHEELKKANDNLEKTLKELQEEESSRLENIR